MKPAAKPNKKLRVAVLGATGSVGQRFITLLQNHPWFELDTLTASERSAGKTYGEAVRWMQTSALDQEIAARMVKPTTAEAVAHCPIVFSALDASVAEQVEAAIAKAGCLVVSNTKSHRMHADVPLMVPEINADHLGLVAQQSFGEGAILTNPNCSTIGVTLALKPLLDAFGVEAVHVVTLQALSGAGIPGVSSMEIADNIVPFIQGEEDKLESEARKIFGRLDGQGIEHHHMIVSAACNRVAVIDGHTACISVKLGRDASEEEILTAWREFRGVPQELSLPTAPTHPVHVMTGDDHPQPRLHRDLEKGMAASVGRLRPCPLLGWKFVTLSHNTLRGAAGGALLVAELALAKGVVRGVDLS